MKRALLAISLFSGGWPALAQFPTVSPLSLSFTYQVNTATFPKAQTVKATLPSTVPSNTSITVGFSSTPAGWLTVTPSGTAVGVSPLTLSVTVNPTSLSPGSYSGSITVTNPISPTYTTTINVTFAVTSPPSYMSPLAVNPAFDPEPSGVTTLNWTFDYTSGNLGAITPYPYSFSVSTNGDIIPFTVTTAVTKSSSGTVGNWLRVYNPSSGTGVYSTSTSGVAAAGSNAIINLALDPTSLNSLDSVPYTGTVTVAAVNPANGTFVVNVTLNVFAGTPHLNITPPAVPIFPSSIPALPAVSAVTPLNPVLTVYGSNFFASGSKVFMTQLTACDGTGTPVGTPLGLTTTWVSRQVLTAVIPAANVTAPAVAPQPGYYPVCWAVNVINGASASNPSNGGPTGATSPEAVLFQVTDPSLPFIQSVVNAASYWPSATQLGPNPNPVQPPNSAISPREIISIFGQNLGPTPLVAATPTGTPPTYPILLGNPQSPVSVTINVGGTPYAVPLIMVSANQINAIVPWEIMQSGGTVGTITVSIGPQGNQVPSLPFPVTVVIEDPAIFTFGGNGQGQAAVLNYDSSTGAVTVNGKTAAAARGSIIEIYATGLGDLSVPPSGTVLGDGEVASGALSLADNSYRVLINGQSAPVSYAGTSPNSVAGLVQLNAAIPPNSPTGAAVPITVEIGVPQNNAINARSSQTGVTIAIK